MPGKGGVQVADWHCPVKSVIPATFELMGVEIVTSEIDIVADVYGEPASRYFSLAEYIINSIELKHPNMGGLESPE